MLWTVLLWVQLTLVWVFLIFIEYVDFPENPSCGELPHCCLFRLPTSLSSLSFMRPLIHLTLQHCLRCVITGRIPFCFFQESEFHEGRDSVCVCIPDNWPHGQHSVLRHFGHFRLFETLWTVAHQAPLSVGCSRQEYWSGLPFPSPVHESEKWKGSHSAMSDSSRPHGLQPTRLLPPWHFPDRSTGVGCHSLLHPALAGRL